MLISRVDQEGQITLPPQAFEGAAWKKGGLVAFVPIKDGILLVGADDLATDGVEGAIELEIEEEATQFLF